MLSAATSVRLPAMSRLVCPAAGVGGPGVVGGFAHGLVRTVAHAVAVEVVVEGLGSAVAQAEGGGGFVGVGEAVQVGELDGADVVGQQAQRAAGFDGGELGGVTEEADDGAAFAGVGGEPVEVAGAGHAGFVDEDEVAGVEHEPLVRRAAAGSGVVGVAELVQVLRAAAELRAEDVGRGGGRCEGDDAAAGGAPGLGDGLHGGGLAGAGRPDADDESAGVGREAGDECALAAVQLHAGGVARTTSPARPAAAP